MGFFIWLCSEDDVILIVKLWFLVGGGVESQVIRQRWWSSFFCRCLSRPKSFWSTCTKSPWSTSSRRTPCCTDTPSRWPPWCACGSDWNHCEPICSAAGQRWPRICAAGKSHKCQTASVCFSFPAPGGWLEDLQGPLQRGVSRILWLSLEVHLWLFPPRASIRLSQAQWK